jgi:hypothetical protein
MLQYFVPRIPLSDLKSICKAALLGGLVGGLYGVLNDQITYSISAEYFSKLKFKQFYYADFGLGDRPFAAAVGFLSSGVVGFIVTWFLARHFISNQAPAAAFRQIRLGFAIIFGVTMLGGIMGFAYGIWRGPEADYDVWSPIIRRHDIKDEWSFARVAYIHNASYLAGVVGTILAFILVHPGGQRRNRVKSQPTSQME